MRKLLFSIFCAVIFLLFPKVVGAAGEFATDTSISYDVDANGRAHVTHTITVENVFTDVYATSYSLNLHALNPSAVEAFEGSKKLVTEVKQSLNMTSINVTFPDALVGRGQRRTFTISYTDDKIVARTGEVWEAFIPKLSDPNSFNSYTVKLFIPQSLGELAYVSPTPSDRSIQGTKNVFTFEKAALVSSPIKAAFGRFQVFSLDLTYHLENPLNKRAYMEIAVPPDTQYQKIILQNISPPPTDLYTDQDGNWLAKYILDARERIDVKVLGSVQLFAQPRGEFLYGSAFLEENTKPSPVWQTDDPAIRELALKLKTPRAIYDYVVNTLAYDYGRVKPNVTRSGASQALKNPKNSICMEFTDLFIALARAAGIPAREINGFAYTDNPEIQPLSLVSDVLHSWPEYWDSAKAAWVPIDPTWGSTTGGLDYFSKLDLRHVTFVIHGKDAYKPYPPGSYKLGPNPQKDVFVAFGQLPLQRDPSPELLISMQKFPFLGKQNAVMTVSNNGHSALEPQSIDILFDSQKAGSYQTKSILPYGRENFEVPLPYSLFGYKMPLKMTATMGTLTKTVPTQRSAILLMNSFVALVFVVALVGMAIWIYKSKHKVFSFKNFQAK